MPELPEVEIYRRYVERHALGQRIESVELTDRRILHRTKPALVGSSLSGRSFTGTRRHGKHLFVATSGDAWLYLHFGMTGDLHYGADVPRFARLIVGFEGGARLAFEDMRLFGRVGIVADPERFIRDHRLGPDPLDPAFTREAFTALLHRRRGAIKSLLMNQRNVAGLGNLWVDEILYQTSVNPRASVGRIAAAKQREMYAVMRRILTTAIARQERKLPNPRTWLIDRREEGARCMRCGGAIARTVVFGRTTYYCARHQGGGKR